MQRLKYLTWAAFCTLWVLVGLWIVQDNPDPTTLRLLGFALGDLPLGVWIIGIFFLGAAIGLLSGSIALLRLRREVRRYRSKAMRTSQESPVRQIP